MHLVFLTLGSRGDLQPLVVLASQYRKRYKDDLITIVASNDLYYLFEHTCKKFTFKYYPIKQSIKSSDRMAEMKQIWEACNYLQPSKLVYTTFVLEGYSIAEKLGIASVVISLFPLNLYPIPKEFESHIQRTYPELYKNTIKPHWSYIQHWMWRLFLEDQGDFREYILDLDPIPLLTHLPTLIYALDPYVYSDYPKEISIAAGFWSPSDTTPIVSSPPLSSEPTLLIHFGSMDTLSKILIEPEKTFVQQIKLRVNEILSKFGTLRIVWMVTPGTTFYQHLNRLNHDRIHIIAPEEHDYFIRHNNVIGVIHHGGINTCCSMVQYSLHQAILPFMFDQNYWANRFSEIGVAKVLDIESSWVNAITWMYDKKSTFIIESVQEKLATNSVIGLQSVLDILNS